jgi:hypothetical protein
LLIALEQAKEGLALATQGLAEHRAAGAILNTPLHLAVHVEAHCILRGMNRIALFTD